MSKLASSRIFIDLTQSPPEFNSETIPRSRWGTAALLRIHVARCHAAKPNPTPLKQLVRAVAAAAYDALSCYRAPVARLLSAAPLERACPDLSFFCNVVHWCCVVVCRRMLLLLLVKLPRVAAMAAAASRAVMVVADMITTVVATVAVASLR
jgi:hypothetical protein